MNYVITALLWIGYCALHSYLISIKFTDRMSRFLKSYYAYYRVFYILISFALLIPLITFTAQSDTHVIITYEYPFSIVRDILISGSLLLFFLAFFLDYDALSFFGIRQILNSRKAKNGNAQEVLKKTGLLGILRHPMYLALLIYLWCQTFRVMDIVINIVLSIYVIIGTKLEERKLIAEFGDAYINYQQEVPMLIPFTKTKKAS